MKTKYKIYFAKIIYNFLKLFLKRNNLIISRKNLKWSIDISEAIDLHLFLFGYFEKEIFLTAKLLNLSNKNCILDIGANFGVQSLQFANMFPNSMIYSIEPTNFAFEKMLKNIDLNPICKKNIFPEQLFISNDVNNIPENIYSSWSLNKNIEAHIKHKGVKKSTSSSKIITLDDFIIKRKITDIDFIKLDVDGSELMVLKSGVKFLKNKKPPIFMELAPYLHKEHGYELNDLLEFIIKIGYQFYEIDPVKKIIDIKKFSSSIKDGSSKNILLKAN